MILNSRFGKTVSCVLLLGLAVAGCRHRPANTAAAPTDNIFHIAMSAAPTTFDPAMVVDGSTIDMLQQVFEGLVRWTPQNTVGPALATKWEISADGRTYTFHIRPGVTFQNGKALAAQDVCDSFRRALDPKLQSTVALTYLGDIVGAEDVRSGKSDALAGIKVIDPLTVAITIKSPKPYWIYTLTYPTDYIVANARGLGDAPLTSDQVKAGLGTGPFALTAYEPDSRVTLAANLKYWDGAPAIAGEDRPIVINPGTRHALYLSGKLDIVDEPKASLAADVQDASVKDQVKYWPRAGTFYIGLNQKAFAPFADVRVRQALAYATDKARIRHVALKDQQDIAEDLLSEGIPGWDAGWKGIPYDPAKAKQLLAAAGYPDGKGFPSIPVSYRQGDPEYDQTVDLLRDMWQTNLGITVEAKRMEWGTFLNREHKGALECFYNSWSADYLDQQDYYSTLLHSGSATNFTGYSNPKFDALCDQADTAGDASKRTALYRQAARIASDDAPVIPLYYIKDIELVKPYVQNIEDTLMGHLPYYKLVLHK